MGLRKRLLLALTTSVALFLFGAAQGSAAQQPGTRAAEPSNVAASDAAAQPSIGPAPTWVSRVELPDSDTGDDAAPIRILLHDQQVSLEAGRQTTYSDVAVRIQTPAGLATGNVSLPWRSGTDVLTVHSVEIRRGDQVIDVLASGQTFTVIRREQNLEHAILDGVLTANMQPEGLQVGDILRIAASVTTNDPVLGNHVEAVGAAWNVAPIARAHLSVQWPPTLRVSHRLTSALPRVRIARRNGVSRFDLTIDDLQPIAVPRGAPPRFAFVRLAEFTSAADWSDVAGLMFPLYEQASRLPPEGPLLAEVSRIREQSADPVTRAEAALALVQDRIRYVALQMGAGGWVPADAATTWSRRFGDCKGKTALLLAILRALDIQAEPVLVSTVFGDGLDRRAPMIGLFDHVLVRATIAGREYWLDGTRSGDTRLASLEVPNFRWGLPVARDGAALVRMEPRPLESPRGVRSVAIDARAGLFAPAPIHAEYVVRGDEAVIGNVQYSSIGGDARDRFLRDYWRQQYDNVDITGVSVAFDPEARELRLAMDGVIRMNWAGGFRVDDIDLGYRADFHRDPGPNSDAPFAVAYPAYERMVATVQFPPGSGVFSIRGGEDVSMTAAGIEFRRRAGIRDNVFHGEASWRSVAAEFPAEDATAAQAAIRALDAQAVSMVAPTAYRPTEADVAALAAAAPADAAGFVRRGNVYLEGGRYDEALADFDRAVALEPQNGLALANRGIARVWRGDLDAARRDLDAAAAVAPDQVIIFRARGLLAQNERAMPDAIAAYSRALAIDQDDAFSLGHRAEAYYATGEHERALGDAAAALRRNPRWTNLYLLRANIFRGRGDNAGAAAEADALIAAAPDDTYARVVAARIYQAVGRRDDALREIERALATAPESYVYLNRASIRPKRDLEGRLADISAALRLDPDSVEALTLRAEVLQERGDYQGAIADLTRALRASPADSGLLTRRGVNHALAGRQALADADFAAARGNADNPSVLNNMCWAKATAGVMLQSALADCDAALAQRPESAGFLDSRGLVLLRLGRLDEAIAAYDRALSISPNMPTSLYGRGLARRLKGAEQQAQADFTAATAIDADIGAEFELYGLSLRPQ